MANIDGTVTENIRQSIAIGQTVYDKEGKRVGTVDMVYQDTGHFAVEPVPFFDKERPFSDEDLYVPFQLITNIDPRELYLSVSRDELHRDYTNPPARSTVVVDENGREVATTMEQSGYGGAPIVVERVNIDRLKKQIRVGDHVYTSELIDLGTVKKYDATTGWMLVDKGVLSDKHDLMVPVTAASDVDRETGEVYLAVSKADLERMHVEPAYVVFVDATVREDS